MDTFIGTIGGLSQDDDIAHRYLFDQLASDVYGLIKAVETDHSLIRWNYLAQIEMELGRIAGITDSIIKNKGYRTPPSNGEFQFVIAEEFSYADIAMRANGFGGIMSGWNGRLFSVENIAHFNRVSKYLQLALKCVFATHGVVTAEDGGFSRTALVIGMDAKFGAPNLEKPKPKSNPTPQKGMKKKKQRKNDRTRSKRGNKDPSVVDSRISRNTSWADAARPKASAKKFTPSGGMPKVSIIRQEKVGESFPPPVLPSVYEKMEEIEEDEGPKPTVIFTDYSEVDPAVIFPNCTCLVFEKEGRTYYHPLITNTLSVRVAEAAAVIESWTSGATDKLYTWEALPKDFYVENDLSVSFRDMYSTSDGVVHGNTLLRRVDAALMAYVKQLIHDDVVKVGDFTLAAQALNDLQGSIIR